MKKLAFALSLFCAAIFAHAGTLESAVTSATQSTAGASNAGNAQNINFNQPGNTDSTLRSAPTVYAPNPVTPFSQASCIYSATGGISIIGVGTSGSIPIDGETCNWRLNTQSIQATAAGLRDLAIAPKTTPEDSQRLLRQAGSLMDVSLDMQCLAGDREQAVLTAAGFCSSVSGIATLDHRFKQPESK